MNLFSVDLEDWFHLLDSPSVPSLERWSALPSRVVKNTLRILDELDAHGVVGTFFVLGWVAEVYPELVAEVASRGHEIASHGYSHTLVYQMSPEEFRDDIRRASDAIHAACSIVPRGYRALGFRLRDRAYGRSMFCSMKASHMTHRPFLHYGPTEACQDLPRRRIY